MRPRPTIIGLLIAAVTAVAGLFAFDTSTSADGPAGPDGAIPPIIPTCLLFDDSFEDNDDILMSSYISLPFSETNLCSVSGDDDWFAFSASQGGEIQIDATFTHADGDVDIDLWSGPLAQVATSHSVTDNEKITYPVPTSGFYLVRVHLFSGSYNNYDLEISATCPPASGAGSVFSDALKAPLEIADLNFITGLPIDTTNCIQVGDTRQINDLDVGLDISHTWVGDLTVTLTHEDTGTSVTLIDRPGAPPGSCDGNDIDATLDDEAFSPVQDECFAGTPTIDGPFSPNEPLSAFDGESMAGTWTLHISDSAVTIIGTSSLNGWSLIAGLKEPTPTPTDTPTPTNTATSTPSPTPTGTTPPTNTPTNTPASTPTAPAGLLGDVNCDGFVNAIDSALILQLIAGLTGSLPCGEHADVNEDGMVNSIDSALILQFVADLIHSLPP